MQVEILPSGKRRCHWAAEEKARIVAETLVSGAKVAEVVSSKSEIAKARHLHRVPIGPSRHGGASECHVRYARGNLGHSSTLHVATIPPTGLGGRGQGKLIERIDIR
jgi:hypothetical protein